MVLTVFQMFFALAILFILLMLGLLGYRMWVHKGYVGAQFGAKTKREVGEITAKSSGARATLGIYKLAPRNIHEGAVGIDIRIPYSSSYQRTFLTLSQEEATALESLLHVATQDRDQNAP